MKKKPETILNIGIALSAVLLVAVSGYAVWKYKKSQEPVVRVMQNGPGQLPPISGQ